MKKGYWIVAYQTVGDDASMKSYGELAGAALAPFGVRILVSPKSAVMPRESGLDKMMVVFEFSSYAESLAAYETPDYRSAINALGPEVIRDFRIAEGS